MKNSFIIGGAVIANYKFRIILEINEKSIVCCALNDTSIVYRVSLGLIQQIPLTNKLMHQLGFIECDFEVYAPLKPDNLEIDYKFIVRYHDGLFYLGDTIIENLMHLQALSRYYSKTELNLSNVSL